MPKYLRLLQTAPSTEAAQLAGRALLQFLFLLLHTLHASHLHLQGPQKGTEAMLGASSPDQPTPRQVNTPQKQAQLLKIQPQLPS